MASYSFNIFDPDAFELEVGDGALDGGDRFRIRSDWSTASDATRLDIVDGGAGATFDGDGDGPGDDVASDGDQTATATDAAGDMVAGGAYIESAFEATAPDGGTITIYLLEIDGQPVGYIADAPVQPGVTYEAGPIFEIDGSNAPDYADLISADYDPDDATLIEGGDLGDGIDAGGGDDTIYGGAGDDTILAGAGDDTVQGHGGNDSVDLGTGDDSFGSANDDPGNDTIDGGTGDDNINAGDGDDLVFGGAGNDTLSGGRHDDTLYGGAGNDQLVFVDVHHTAVIDGGDGYDRLALYDHLSSTNGASVLFTDDDSGTFAYTDLGASGTFTDIEWVTGGGLGDTFDASATTQGTRLDGYGGGDTLIGGSGDDLLYGWGDDDSITGGTGDDTIYGGDGQDVIEGGGGDDTIYGDDGSDAIEGGDGDDSILGGNGDDTLDGGAGNDTLRADSGDDLLRGGAGNDRLVAGGQGNTLEGGAGNDTLATNSGGNSSVEFDGGDGYDRIEFYSTNLVTDGIQLTFDGNGSGTFDYVETTRTGTFSGIEDVFTTARNDTIDASASTTGIAVRAGSGDDLITGGSGATMRSLVMARRRHGQCRCGQ